MAWQQSPEMMGAGNFSESTDVEQGHKVATDVLLIHPQDAAMAAAPMDLRMVMGTTFFFPVLPRCAA